ncbi:mycothiol transferase [Geodermatophilus sp. SYSU D00815]
MRSRDLLLYAYGQIRETLRPALEGLTAEQLTARVGPGANTIAWLAWHLLRVQDDHVAEVAGREQVWTAEGFAGRFGLPFDDSATGYGFDPDEVAAVRVDCPDLLLDYAAAVHARTEEFLRGLTDDDLDRVVDRRWDPPVTLGVRLVSVLSDDLQHVGQAAYVRGLLDAG